MSPRIRLLFSAGSFKYLNLSSYDKCLFLHIYLFAFIWTFFILVKSQTLRGDQIVFAYSNNTSIYLAKP